MLRRVVALIGLAVLIVSTMAACGRTDVIRVADRDCASARSLPGGDSTRTIVSGGQSREYLLHVPPGYDGSSRAPVVMLFHGLGGDPRSIVETTRMEELADRDGTLLVAPLARGLVPRWDFGSPITDPRSDLAFVRDLVKEVRTEACVDAGRVYATGFSNGSVLTLALACDGTTKFAAYGAVSGPYPADACTQAPPASLIYFHGLRDTVVPYDGAPTAIGPLPPVNEIMAGWAAHDFCPPAGATTTVAEHVRHFAWNGCAGGSAVEVYVADNGGHRWPGGEPSSSRQASGATTLEIDASSLIWKFFARHAADGQ
ncbi:extracellular catalytic domain type 1 short-chain-length polyhydroxyalkanoate depolymerase [Aeromicrobium sp.]|uniref:extracellular catalytic domain type 1 short-chain-length polyhydroxyalkanoate depolymerase n=1 Tax=Aeromicrobium sp. TaxID=1871063 RepID=UPI003C5D7BFB